MNKLLFFLDFTRAYALPMSITAWAIPFALGYFEKGNIIYGLLSLIGIICAHLGANVFDDIIDYKNYLKNKKNELNINLKKGKCKYFLDNTCSLKYAFIITFSLFAIATLIGLFFVKLYNLPIILIVAITGILSLIYPKSGYLGLSEVIIGTIYSPLLFTGVYYVMTGHYSIKLLWLSMSFMLVTITLLYTDFFLDFTTDRKEKKKTWCTLLGNKKYAYYFYIFIICLIYAIILLGICLHILPMKYMIILISGLFAIKSIKSLSNYIEKDINNEQDFLNAMNTTQKFIAMFSVLCIISFYLTK